MTITSAVTSDVRLNDIIETTAVAVESDPANGQFVFTAKASAGPGVASTVTTGRHRIEVDEPPLLGGGDAAANPVQYYLAALLSCQVVTYRFWADRLGVAIDDLTLSAEGDIDIRGFFGLDPAVRPGFTAVRVTVTISGPESAERYAELRRIVDRHCPVLDLTAQPTPVQTNLVLA
jgi:uncharacterized OsmC-like protein